MGLKGYNLRSPSPMALLQFYVALATWWYVANSAHNIEQNTNGLLGYKELMHVWDYCTSVRFQEQVPEVFLAKGHFWFYVTLL